MLSIKFHLYEWGSEGFETEKNVWTIWWKKGETFT